MKRQFRITSLLLIITGILAQLAFAAQYKYDNLHRLTRVIYDNGLQITYRYDEVGNRTRRISTLIADTYVDGSVNFHDFAILASHWLEEDCSYTNEWCYSADIDWSSEVDIDDLAILAQQWMESVD